MTNNSGFLKSHSFYKKKNQTSAFLKGYKCVLSGRCINFNSVMILVLVLRYTITILRNMGLAPLLPLDHNVYFHKLVGWLLFAQSWLHTIMHLINFGKK